MGASDLRLIGANERATAHDVDSADDEPVDAVRAGEDESGERVDGAAELEPIGRPDREVGLLAGLECADVVPPEHGRAAPRPEPKRLARGHRLPAAAPAGHEERLLDLHEQVAPLVRRGAVHAQPDANAGIDERSYRRDAGTQAQVRGRAVRDARTRFREASDLAVGEVDAMRAPHVVGEPAETFEVLHRRAAVQLSAVRLLLDRLGEVRVEREPEAPRERGRLLHQPSGDRERRARCDGDLHARARPRLVERRVESLRLGQHRVELLDELVGRQAAVRRPEIHRPARGNDADSELARRLDLCFEDPVATAWEDVMVIEDGCAARERELREARPRGGVLGVGVDSRPDGIQLPQPGEEVGLLRSRAREGLVEVVVRVDKPGRDDGAAEVDALVRRIGQAPWFLATADSLDGALGDEHPAGLVLRRSVVHRDDPAVRVERPHARGRYRPPS